MPSEIQINTTAWPRQTALLHSTHSIITHHVAIVLLSAGTHVADAHAGLGERTHARVLSVARHIRHGLRDDGGGVINVPVLL
jgi:hypothetical protein